jgi:hypothetical protein
MDVAIVLTMFEKVFFSDYSLYKLLFKLYYSILQLQQLAETETITDKTILTFSFSFYGITSYNCYILNWYITFNAYFLSITLILYNKIIIKVVYSTISLMFVSF